LIAERRKKKTLTQKKMAEQQRGPRWEKITLRVAGAACILGIVAGAGLFLRAKRAPATQAEGRFSDLSSMRVSARGGGVLGRRNSTPLPDTARGGEQREQQDCQESEQRPILLHHAPTHVERLGESTKDIRSITTRSGADVNVNEPVTSTESDSSQTDRLVQIAGSQKAPNVSDLISPATLISPPKNDPSLRGATANKNGGEEEGKNGAESSSSSESDSSSEEDDDGRVFGGEEVDEEVEREIKQRCLDALRNVRTSFADVDTTGLGKDSYREVCEAVVARGPYSTRIPRGYAIHYEVCEESFAHVDPDRLPDAAAYKAICETAVRECKDSVKHVKVDKIPNGRQFYKEICDRQPSDELLRFLSAVDPDKLPNADDYKQLCERSIQRYPSALRHVRADKLSSPAVYKELCLLAVTKGDSYGVESVRYVDVEKLPNPMAESYQEICEAAVTANGGALGPVNPDKLPPGSEVYVEICKKAVRRSPSALNRIDAGRVTREEYEEICRVAFDVMRHRSNYYDFQWVNAEKLSNPALYEEFSRAAVANDGFYLHHVQTAHLPRETYDEVCLSAVDQDPQNPWARLKYVDADRVSTAEKYKEICAAAVAQPNSGKYELSYVKPNKLPSPQVDAYRDLCLRSVELYPGTLQDVDTNILTLGGDALQQVIDGSGVLDALPLEDRGDTRELRDIIRQHQTARAGRDSSSSS